MEAVVYHEVERCAQVWHVAAEGFVWVYGNVQSVDVQSVVRLEESRDVGIFVSLHFLCRESEALEVFEGGISAAVHHVIGVPLYHFPALFVEFYILFFALHLLSVYSYGLMADWQ